MTLNKFSNVEEEFIALGDKPIDFTAILIKYLSYWKWFVVSVLLLLMIAVIYIYFILPTYEIATSIVFKDEQRGGGRSEERRVGKGVDLGGGRMMRRKRM